MGEGGAVKWTAARGRQRENRSVPRPAIPTGKLKRAPSEASGVYNCIWVNVPNVEGGRPLKVGALRMDNTQRFKHGESRNGLTGNCSHTEAGSFSLVQMDI